MHTPSSLVLDGTSFHDSVRTSSPNFHRAPDSNTIDRAISEPFLEGNTPIPSTTSYLDHTNPTPGASHAPPHLATQHNASNTSPAETRIHGHSQPLPPNSPTYDSANIVVHKLPSSQELNTQLASPPLNPSAHANDDSSFTDSIDSHFEAELESKVASGFFHNTSGSDEGVASAHNVEEKAPIPHIATITSKLDAVTLDLSETRRHRQSFEKRLADMENKTHQILQIQHQILAATLESTNSVRTALNALPTHTQTLDSISGHLAKIFASISRIESQGLPNTPTQVHSSGISFASSTSDNASKPPSPSINFRANMASLPTLSDHQKPRAQTVPSQHYSPPVATSDPNVPTASQYVDPTMASILKTLVDSKTSKAPSHNSFPSFSGDSKSITFHKWYTLVGGILATKVYHL